MCIMSADIRHAQRMPSGVRDHLQEFGNSGHVDTLHLLLHHVLANAVIPGNPMSDGGMWVAGLPTGVNWRWAMVDF